MILQDIMVKDVATISPEATIANAARRMREKSVGCLVVTIERAVKRIITDRDLLGCISEAHNPSACEVSTHMSRPVIIERPEEDLKVAADVMRKNHIKRLPVVSDGKLVGLISFSDIARIAHKQAADSWPAWCLITDLIKAQALHQRLPNDPEARAR